MSEKIQDLMPESEDMARWQNNLERLLHDAPERPKTRGDSMDEILAWSMPLSHATGASSFRTALQEGMLLSFPKLVEAGRELPRSVESPRVETILGTENFVFTYAAPFRYPSTDCGFLFRAEVEQLRSDAAVATPFDSGATVKYLRPRDSKEEQVAFVRTHELPVPEYRRLLARMLAGCFDSPWDYIHGQDPAELWPIPVEGGDQRRWTFEVRFQDVLELQHHLIAVFLPENVATEVDILSLLERWEAEGIDVVEYLSWEDLETGAELFRHCAEYVLRLLGRGDRAT